MLTKIFLCPADKKYGCTWEGSSNDIYEHFSEEHEELLFFSGSVSIPLDVASENRLLLFDTEIYLLQTKINEEHLNIYLRYLGPALIASNLTYDIDLTVNGVKLEKRYIIKEDGCFSVSLKCIEAHFGEVDAVNCQLLVSGDFAAQNSDIDDVFEDAPKKDEDIELMKHLSPSLQNLSQETNEITSENIKLMKHLSPSLQNLSEETNEIASENIKLMKHLSPSLQNLSTDRNVEVREKPDSSNEPNRATWYVIDSYLPKQPASSLNRSHTFSSEDIRRNSALRRHASMRSLGSIPETDLDFELKCSNCDSHLSAPIFLCAYSHNICPTCYADYKSCIICDKEITGRRNEELETKAIDHVYTCTNQRNGCHKKLPFDEIVEHELNCTFCQFLCPMDECGFNSGYRNMVAHLNLIHSSVKMFQSFIAVFQKHQEIFLANETMGIFYCNWKQIDSKIVWRAKYCGPKGRKFFCELKFKGKTFKKPLLLTKNDECYFKEMELAELKEQKVKAKNSILTVTR